MIKKIDKQIYEEALREKDRLTVLYFTAEWCPYCKLLAPAVEEMAVEHASEIDVYSVNVDENPQISEIYGIMAIPAVVVLKNGEIKANAVNPGSKEALLGLVF